jgi:hypothetical protein
MSSGLPPALDRLLLAVWLAAKLRQRRHGPPRAGVAGRHFGVMGETAIREVAEDGCGISAAVSRLGVT